MYKPEATIRIMTRTGRRVGVPQWGAKKMEQRVLRCCSDNPECELGLQCNKLYDRFVKGTSNYKEPTRKDKPRKSVVDTYTLHGLKLSRDIVRC